ncbi:MAG TPA: c-type cytochrome [Bacteroidetes bacterium]|nr:c-type cytochrome [Bacteroidota bacterium]
MKIKYLLYSSLFIFAFSSCIKDQVETEIHSYSPEEYATLTKALDLPQEPLDYMLELPAHLGSSRVNSEKHQATLGRVLFYDKRLSKNEKVSCSSCHLAERAFADDKKFSEGFDGGHTKRNSLALGAFPSFNAYYGFGGTRMFWDERAATVAEQSDLTMRDPIEMGIEDLDVLGDELMQIDYYRTLFDKAYPANKFGGFISNKDKILQALDAFVSSIGSYSTKFDEGWAATGNPNSSFANFTQQENEGKQLFNTHCASCHNLGPGFSTTITNANNGLDMVYEDKGIGEISGRSTEMGLFKVPMLRNVALTAPYMHDGRFETLEEVVEHYNSGVKNHPNLHEELKAGNEAKHLNLTQGQKDALVAFLHTLTDTESLAQVKYSDPFKK